MNCCAHIYFNRQCFIKKVTTKYANVRIPYISRAANITQKKVQIIRLKDDIKYLHVKKEKLNSKLYIVEYIVVF
jgi:hypothetical protein